MEPTESLTGWADLGWRVAATFVALLGAFIARRGWHKATKEYDRSMLIRLGTDEEALDYANAPVIVGQFPFNELAGAVESNLDVRNVIGFVVGKPIWIPNVLIPNVWWLHIGLDQSTFGPGYYAYCVIQWEHADKVKRYADQGFHIRRTRYDGPQIHPRMRERIFIGFGTDSEPEVGTGDVPMIAHIQTGPLAQLKYQPYLRGGFKATDIKMRALAPQTKLLIRFKDLFTKEWRNA